VQLQPLSKEEEEEDVENIILEAVSYVRRLRFDHTKFKKYFAAQKRYEQLNALLGAKVDTKSPFLKRINTYEFEECTWWNKYSYMYSYLILIAYRDNSNDSISEHINNNKSHWTLGDIDMAKAITADDFEYIQRQKRSIKAQIETSINIINTTNKDINNINTFYKYLRLLVMMNIYLLNVC
jgi:hypothetical protein